MRSHIQSPRYAKIKQPGRFYFPLLLLIIIKNTSFTELAEEQRASSCTC